MVACLTRADQWDETYSPCEPESAPKPTNNHWSIPNGPPSTPPGIPSTPQSSWQPYSDTNATQNSWVFRRHVLRPPEEPAALKPVVPEIVHPIQYRITPEALLAITRALVAHTSCCVPMPNERRSHTITKPLYKAHFWQQPTSAPRYNDLRTFREGNQKPIVIMRIFCGTR